MASIIFANFLITIDTNTGFFFYVLNRIMLSRLRIISGAPNKFGLRLVHFVRASKNCSNPHSCQPLSNWTSSALIPGNLSIVILTQPFISQPFSWQRAWMLRDNFSYKSWVGLVWELSKAHSKVWYNFWHLKALFKRDEKCFLFHLKNSFRSQDI